MVILLLVLFLCDHTTGWEDHSYTTDGHGVFNTHTHFGYVSYTGRGVWHKHVCTRVDSEGQRKLSLALPRQGIEPSVFELEVRRSK